MHLYNLDETAVIACHQTTVMIMGDYQWSLASGIGFIDHFN
jgi:hypothetical protein